MNTLTITNLDDELKASLSFHAAKNKRTVEDEALQILKHALRVAPAASGLGSRINSRFAHLNLADVTMPSRSEGPRAADLLE